MKLILTLLSFFLFLFPSLTYSPGITEEVAASPQNRDLVYSVTDYGAIGDGKHDDTIAFQKAIDNAIKNSGEVIIPIGTYFLKRTVKINGTVKITGAGMDLVTITGKGDLFHILGENIKDNISIKGITFDNQKRENNSAIIAEYVHNLTISDCKFLNQDRWGIHIGSQNGNESMIVNRNILIENVEFDTVMQTYEQLLIFNSENVTIRNCSFRNSDKGIGLGIYQNTKNVLVDNSTFENLHIGLYYSVSTDEISINHSLFSNNITGIQGANQSDNGHFGQTIAENININDTIFSNNYVGLEIGAVHQFSILNSSFNENYENAIVIDNGNKPVNSPVKNISIKNSIFTNNNQSRQYSVYHPGILFNGLGGDLYVVIDDCSFYDTQSNPSQHYPITFAGPFTWDHIIIKNSRLAFYNSGAQINLIDGAKLGGNVELINITK